MSDHVLSSLYIALFSSLSKANYPIKTPLMHNLFDRDVKLKALDRYTGQEEERIPIRVIVNKALSHQSGRAKRV